MQVPNCSDYPFGFFYACKDLIMANDVVTTSNPPIVLVEEKEFEETPLECLPMAA
jgi:hypothetical protein